MTGIISGVLVDLQVKTAYLILSVYRDTTTSLPYKTTGEHIWMKVTDSLSNLNV